MRRRRARRASRPLPTSDELVLAPDVAILDALRSVIDVTIVAVVAGQPELWPTHDGRDPVRTHEGDAADEVIRAAQVLACAVGVYRDFITGRHI